MQKHWYLGFLGFVGIYKFPEIIDALSGATDWWYALGALWLLWFLEFIPTNSGDQ